MIFLGSLGKAGIGAQMVLAQSPGSEPSTLVIPGWTPQEAALQDRGRSLTSPSPRATPHLSLISQASTP